MIIGYGVLLGGFVDCLARLLLLLGLNLYVVCFLLVFMVVYYGLSSMFECVCGFEWMSFYFCSMFSVLWVLCVCYSFISFLCVLLLCII